MIVRKPLKKDQYDLFIFLNHNRDICKSSGLPYVEDYNNYSIDRLIRNSVKKNSYYAVIEIENRAAGLIVSSFDGNRVELSFAIAKEYQRKGYMSEALNRIQKDIPYDCVCEVYRDNVPCIQCLKKCGFIPFKETENTIWLINEKR